MNKMYFSALIWFDVICLMIDKVFLGENIVTFRWVYIWLDFLTVLFEWKENLSGKFIEKSREETMFY